jgi:hypothetical protein
MPIPGQRPRVFGSGFTVFHWDDGTGEKVIAFADQVQTFGVTPVADAQVIQPMNAVRPVEIVTPAAHTNGRIVLTLTELYNQAVWQRLASLTRANDIIDIMRTIAGSGNGIKISQYVTPPTGIGNGAYLETFHECVVTRVQDDSTIRIDTMTVNKEVELWFTYNIKHWINSPRDVTRVFA